jgi:HAD superfamily hydrolase (TIGR01509 family)
MTGDGGRRAAGPSSVRAGSDRGPVEGVTLDLWYTLVYVTTSERRRLERVRRRVWTDLLVDAGRTRADALVRWSALERWAQTREIAGRAPGVPAQVHRLSRQLGRVLDASDIERRLDQLLLAAKVHPAPGALRTLRALRDRGIRLGLVSNLRQESSDATRTLLNRMPFCSLLGSVQLSPELPWSKPHPGPYRRCLEELGVAPAGAIHVGDQAIDSIGARRAGMRSILYTGLHRLEYFDHPARFHPREAPGEEAASWSAIERWILRGAAPAPLGPRPGPAEHTSKSLPSPGLV